MASKVSRSEFAKDCRVGEFEIAQGLTVLAYSPKTRAYAMTNGCIQKLFTLVTTQLQLATLLNTDSMKEKVQIPLEEIEGSIKVATVAFLKSVNVPGNEKNDKKSDAPEKAKSDAEQPQRKPFGLEPVQLKSCVERASAYVTDWFKSKCSDHMQGGKQIKAWEVSPDAILCADITKDPEINNFILQKLGCIREQAPLAFTAQDLQNFGIAQGEKTADASKMNCAEFALLKTGELRAKKEIFFDPGTFDMDKLPQTLKGWKYTPVPVPKDRDLVMYMNSKKEVTHLGIFNEEHQKVQSKRGNLQPYIHLHGLFDVPTFYGAVACFWRPPVKKA